MKLPNGWAEATVSEVADTKLGKMLDATKNKGNPVAYLRNVNVRWGEFDLSDLQEMRVTPEELEELRVRNGDIFVCEGGEPGRAAIWRQGSQELVFQKALHRIRALDLIQPDYLVHYIKFLASQHEFLGFLTGTTIKHLPQVALQRMDIVVPPGAEQRRIVAKLDVLFARLARARAELDKVPGILARYKRRMLSKAFSGDLTADWRVGRHQIDVRGVLRGMRRTRAQDRQLSKRISVDNGPCDLPECWAWVSPDELADDAKYSLGIGPFGSNLLQSDYTSDGVRLIFVRDIRRGRFDAEGARYVSAGKAEELSQHTVRGGEVLVTKMGEPPGDTALYPVDAGSAIITSDCVKLQPDPRIATSGFLVLAIRADTVKAQLRTITAGVAQQKISLERFRALALPIPPLDEQEEIVTRLSVAFARADRLEDDAARARALLDRLEAAILARAFKGELVPQDPTDEPASVLLERIRAQRGAEKKHTSNPRARRNSASRSANV